jgi:uncharacterized protein involved in exopolysaccharide biosynthesis
MEHVASRPPAPVIEGLLITFFANRRRLLLVPAAVLAASLLAALVVPVRYTIEAQALVALGPEYTYRPQAGEPATVGQALDHDQTMHTESAILASPDLHRATLRAIGVDRLYPKYLEPPGLVARLRGGVTALAALVGLASATPAAPPDPVDLALNEFESALTYDVPKIGSVITVTFRHKDAKLGAEALNTLMALYIQRRADLFRDEQSDIVARQVQVTKAALDDADAKLAQFKLAHQVGGFQAQRDILLHRRGEMQSDRNDAQSQAAQLAVRLDDLVRQLAKVPQDLASGRETDFEQRLSPARSSLEQLRAQYANALVQYRPDAPLVLSLKAQIAAREADVAAGRRDASPTIVRTGQNPTWLSLQDDRLKTETNLAVQKTRLAEDDQHLADLTASINALDASEQELARLELTRTVAEDTYRAANKTLQDRRVTDEVEDHRRATVRVLQPAVPPLYPPPIRRLIVAAGAMLAVFGLAGATLLAHAFGRTYWQPEALEQDFGIAVLAVIPEGAGERRRLARG